MEDLDAFLEIYNTRRPHRGRSMEGRTPYEIFPREIHRKREDRKPPGPKGDGGRSVEPDFDDAGCQVIAVLVQSYHLR